MAQLKLVAGTAVTGAGGENVPITMDDALKAAGTSVAELEARARATIHRLKPGLDGLSVAEMLAEMNSNHAGRIPVAAALRRNNDIWRVLRSVGLHAAAALPEQELDVHVYGIVIEPKKLLAACPALKPCATVLEGLTL